MLDETKVCGRALAALLLVGVAQATTWTVDDDGGAGVDFNDIPDALVVAGPGDTILVAPGSYSAFTLSERITLVGYDAVVAGTIAVVGVQGGGRAAVSGFSAESLEVTSCAGRVFLDQLTIDDVNVFGAHAAVTGSSDVRLRRCVIGGDTRFGLAAGLTVQSSRVEITASSIFGDDGMHGGFCENGADGQAGIRCLVGAEVHLSTSSVVGGNGGNAGPSCLFFPHGGNSEAGIRLTGGGGASLLVTGSAADSIRGGNAGCGDTLPYDGFPEAGLLVGGTVNSARVSGASFVGGMNVCEGLQEPGIRTYGGGTVDEVVPLDASLDTSGSSTTGSVATFVVRGPVGASARIRLGRVPRVTDVPDVFEDRLLAPLRTISLGGIPASGEVTLPFLIGDLWPAGALIMAQASCTTASGTTLSQSVPLIVR